MLFSFKFKYSWLDTKNDFNKFFFNFSENYKFVEFFQTNYNPGIFDNEKFHHINSIIKFKHKLGFFKKVHSIKSTFLNKNISFKSNFMDNSFSKFNNFNAENLTFKNFDFVEKKLFFYKNNRHILKYIFKKRKKREYYINKFIKKISKSNINNFLNSFEFSLLNVLTNSNFFLNRNDIFFFINNNFVYVNNKVVSNSNLVLKKNDFLMLSFNKYYYFLYKNYINNLNFNINKYHSFFKKNSISNFKNEFNFIEKIILIKNDIPSYLEIDYISMSLVLLYSNIQIYNCYDFKILNVFLKRLNN